MCGLGVYIGRFKESKFIFSPGGFVSWGLVVSGVCNMRVPDIGGIVTDAG